jgi:uncharacterized tellurite resistance protein B-like protein
VINGVMVLGIAGLFLIRVVAYSMLFGGGGRSGKDKNGLAIALAIIVFGALVAAVGFLGTLMARLIQAAISRQREYLADASAVQFTRNADGIAGALRRISGSTKKAKFAAEASQFNHMFFSQAMNAAFATHPPLTDRIKRIAGSTTGPDMSTDPREAIAAPGVAASMKPEVSRAGLGIAAGAVAIAGMRNSIAHAGEIGAISMDWTRSILESIPDELRIAARTPRSARALIAAMLMDEGGTDAEALASQRAAMQRLLPAAEVQNAENLRPLLKKLQPAARVPLLDLTSPAMQALSPTQSAELQQLVEALVAADKHVSRFEWIVAILVDAMLDRSGKASHRTAATVNSIVPAVLSILSITATAGTVNRDEAIAAVATACQGLGIQPPERGLESVSIKSINAAVHDLRTLAFAERKRLLEAVVDVVAHDEKTTVDEAEMVRVVSEVLAVPMPPVQPDVLVA